MNLSVLELSLVTPTNSSQSDTLQLKSPHSCKTNRFMLLSGSHKPQKVNHVKHILILLSLLILTFPLVAQETGVLYLKKVTGKNALDYCKSEYNCVSYDWLEADDVMGIMSTEPSKESTIIVSEDKDLLTIPGLHWDFKEEKIFKWSKDQADYQFFYQVLVGDTVDNYKGCQGIGPISAGKILRENNYFDDKKSEPNLLGNLDLVALGTVCDVVNLSDYNRNFIIKGMEIIKKRTHKGISQIIDNSNINHSPTANDLSFIVGPQLNAASRVDDSSLSHKLLISNNLIEIETITKKIFLLKKKF